MVDARVQSLLAAAPAAARERIEADESALARLRVLAPRRPLERVAPRAERGDLGGGGGGRCRWSSRCGGCFPPLLANGFRT